MPKFLFKANNDVISHCACENEPAMSSGQLDCPWCGCGWLIACSRCARAFTFAEIRETDISIEDIGRREVARRGLKNISEANIKAWVASMVADLEPFSVGDVVVYLDGKYLKIDARGVRFDGYFASHAFDRLPHAEARDEPEILERVLGNVQYWIKRELPNRK